MSWEREVEELRQREQLAEGMGGPDKVARQHARGKLDARARLAALVDAGSFREIGKIAGKGRYGPDGELIDLAPSNFLFGRANIDGRWLPRPMTSRCAAGPQTPRSTASSPSARRWRTA